MIPFLAKSNQRPYVQADMQESRTCENKAVRPVVVAVIVVVVLL